MPRRWPADWQAPETIEQALDLNLLVEAGAGSGKTESLARRMAAGVAGGRYEVEGIAAVTFTRKAAAELRGRFQLELERRLAEERDPARRARLETALGHLERLFAGTIHAFCVHLLRERLVEAGVAPGFAEQDEGADVEFRMEAWRDYLDQERAAGSSVLGALEAAGASARDLDEGFRTVCTFADVAFPPGDGECPDPAPARAELERFWLILAAGLPAPITADTTCPVQKAARRFQGLRRVGDDSDPARLAVLLACWTGKTQPVMSRWPWSASEKKAQREQVEGLVIRFQADVVRPWLAAWRQYLYRLAVTLLAGGPEFAAEARRRTLALNYGDRLQLAARLLRDNLEVRARSSWWETPSSRSTASAVRTSTPTAAFARSSSAPVAGSSTSRRRSARSPCSAGGPTRSSRSPASFHSSQRASSLPSIPWSPTGRRTRHPWPACGPSPSRRPSRPGTCPTPRRPCSPASSATRWTAAGDAGGTFSSSPASGRTCHATWRRWTRCTSRWRSAGRWPSASRARWGCWRACSARSPTPTTGPPCSACCAVPCSG